MHTLGKDAQVHFDNLYPALIEVFVVILFGYVAGRSGLISRQESRGLGKFVSHFALPALVLNAMFKLDFTEVNWRFVYGILISKSAVFCLVVIFSLLLIRPAHLGKAGIFAIFATQSNDFALGFPIVEALYKDANPEYLQYIYLMAPISLCLLNPLGFVLMEFHNSKRGEARNQRSRLRTFLNVGKNVVLNPVVVMTVVGLFGNLAFSAKVPFLIAQVLNVLSSAFTSAALFFLGITLVGKVHKSFGLQLVVPAVLIAAKTVLLPLVAREVVEGLNPGNNNNETTDFSNFAFLYGTFPTAPPVFVFAIQYNIAQDLIATAMVAGTLISAPVMFISAKMLTLSVQDDSDYKPLLTSTTLDVAVVATVLAAWTLLVLLVSRKFRRMPHFFTACLVCSQLVACIGLFLYNAVDMTSSWQRYLQFAIFLVGVLSTRVWVAALAMAICFLRLRGLCFLIRYRTWLVLPSVLIPILMTGILMIFAASIPMQDVSLDPEFQYGRPQRIVSIIVLSGSLIVSLASLVVQHRYAKYHHQMGQGGINRRFRMDSEMSDPAAADETKSLITGEQQQEAIADSFLTDRFLTDNINTESSVNSNSRKFDVSSASHPTDIEDLVDWDEADEDLEIEADLSTRMCPHGASCTAKERRGCEILIKRYDSIQQSPPTGAGPSGGGSSGEAGSSSGGGGGTESSGGVEDHHEITRHLLLILLHLLSITIGLFLCMWRLFSDARSGIYLELEFLDGVFNFGQSFFAFACFGLNSDVLTFPCVRWLRAWWYGSGAEMDGKDKHICHQFVKHHMERCREDLCRWMTASSGAAAARGANCGRFSGGHFVAWLLEVGLSGDESEARRYAQALLAGQVLRTTEQHPRRQRLRLSLVFGMKRKYRLADADELPSHGDAILGNELQNSQHRPSTHQN